jgi:hypothetical protein
MKQHIAAKCAIIGCASIVLLSGCEPSSAAYAKHHHAALKAMRQEAPVIAKKIQHSNPCVKAISTWLVHYQHAPITDVLYDQTVHACKLNAQAADWSKAAKAGSCARHYYQGASDFNNRKAVIGKAIIHNTETIYDDTWSDTHHSDKGSIRANKYFFPGSIDRVAYGRSHQRHQVSMLFPSPKQEKNICEERKLENMDISTQMKNGISDK